MFTLPVLVIAIEIFVGVVDLVMRHFQRFCKDLNPVLQLSGSGHECGMNHIVYMSNNL